MLGMSWSCEPYFHLTPRGQLPPQYPLSMTRLFCSPQRSHFWYSIEEKSILTVSQLSFHVSFRGSLLQNLLVFNTLVLSLEKLPSHQETEPSLSSSSPFEIRGHTYTCCPRSHDAVIQPVCQSFSPSSQLCQCPLLPSVTQWKAITSSPHNDAICSLFCRYQKAHSAQAPQTLPQAVICSKGYMEELHGFATLRKCHVC